MSDPKYGSVKSCPKCGNERRLSEIMPHFTLCGPDWAATEWIARGEPIPLAEYIRRTCERCGYSWEEAPLDAEKADA